ncbi:UNVERIFIED_CONTAM: hypothetical protein K2H54_019228, partial [Gekko kuhli]
MARRPPVPAAAAARGRRRGGGRRAGGALLPEEVQPAVVEDGGVELEREEVGAGEAQRAPGAHVQQDERPVRGALRGAGASLRLRGKGENPWDTTHPDRPPSQLQS